MRLNKNLFILLLIIAACGTASGDDGGGEQDEYYGFYFHPTDKDNFDGPPGMYEKMDEITAVAKETYTVVRKDQKGRITEAVSILNGKPNYYYRYLYAFIDGSEQILSEMFYAYNENGAC